jgi:DNA-binding MarR family transcriptional regulator
MAQEPDPVGAWAALIRVHATVVPKLERALQNKGLPLAWYDVLLVLNAAPDRRLRMTELGDRAVLSRTRISRVVAELEAAGLVARQLDDHDRRCSYAEITANGRARLRAAAPTYLNGIAEHYSRHLTKDEARTITSALGKVLAAEGP